ncbi:MAG: Extracellular ligand-binding receptor [Frankiales bacterium]|nr:Extracellular ligand-binding receptor [Frankiales bacterium]
MGIRIGIRHSSMRRPGVKVAALGIAFTLLLAGCSSSKSVGSTSSGTTPGGASSGASARVALKIGFIGPLSGAISSLVVPVLQGAQLAAAQLNSKGGSISIQTCDDQFTLDLDVSCYQKLKQQQHVDVVVGPLGSANAAAVQKLASKDDVFQYALTALTSSEVATAAKEEPGRFNVYPTDNAIIGRSMEFANSQGWKKVYVITTRNVSGKNFAQNVQNVVAKYAGMSEVGSYALAPDGSDAQVAIADIAQHHPDVIYTPSFGQPVPSLISAEGAEASPVPLLIQLINCDSVTGKLIAGVQSARQIVYSTCFPAILADQLPAAAEDATATEFTAAYTQKYGVPPGALSTGGYDAVNQLAAAAAAGSTKSSDLQAAFAKMGTVIGAGGTFQFGPGITAGIDDGRSLLIAKFDAGKWVYAQGKG